MHVVLVSGYGSDELGGVAVDIRNLREGLRGVGVEADSVSQLGDVRRALRDGAEVVHVFGCVPSPAIFGSLAAARAAHRVVVWTPVFHPSRKRTWQGYGLRRPPMEAFDRIAPRAARRAHAVLAATEAERDFFARWTRAELIPPGVPEPPAGAVGDLAAARARLGVHGGPVVLVVARDNSRKALPFGLEAFRLLLRELPDAQLLLVGPPRDHPYAREPGVVVPGWLDPADVELAYRVADVLFVCSRYEGLPRAVIEAWRLARPAVVTDRVALAPLVATDAGRVVPFGDATAAARALVELLRDASLRRNLGGRGLELVRERFVLSRVVTDTEHLYRDLLAKG